MKLEAPPAFKLLPDLLERIWKGDFQAFLSKSDERYYYYDDIKHRNDLPFENIEDSWSLIKAYRTSKYEYLTFGKHKFRYYVSPFIAKTLHEFDLKLIGGLQQNPILPVDRPEFFKNSLLEEAVASSQVEGAATTTQVAREMLKSGRHPRNESEQMIFNNLKAIEYISAYVNAPLDFSLIIELHKIMTVNTDAEKYSGGFRKGEVFVTDHVNGEVAHIPPHWDLVAPMMQELCTFINDDNRFIHPIVKAAIIHFMIGFIHPFKDGNGRTARALFYWYLLKKGYSLVKNISISRVILESRTQYDKAFLKTELDANDLNYFITYSIKNIEKAFEKLVSYRDKKLEERKNANLLAYELLEKGLNRRQADTIGYLFLKTSHTITLNVYSEKFNIVRQTASKDLNELIKLGYIKEDRSTKPYQYSLKSKAIAQLLK